MKMKKVAVAMASTALVAFLGLEFAAPAFAAAKKPDCEKVMEELNAGKKIAEVAKDLGTTRYQVRKCKAAAKAKAAAEATPAPAAPPAAPPAEKK
jgi:hypothetical protein